MATTVKEALMAVKVVKKAPTPSKVATLATQQKVREAHRIKAQIAPLEAKLKAIQEDVEAEMDRKGVNLLTTKDGIPVVGRDPQSRFFPQDTEEFITKWPKLAAKYLKETKFFRINWKKPID